MATPDWQGQLQDVWSIVLDSIDHLKNMDFKQLSYRDMLTLVGLTVTAAKSLLALWQVYTACKQYGVASLSRPNLVERYGTWAVMTGAENGIGEAYMTELAMCGVNIVLVSYAPERIRPAAVHMEEKYKIKVHIADIDFSDCSTVYDQIMDEIGNRPIGILVNSIDISQEDQGNFHEMEPELLYNIFHGNVLASSMMTHMVLPGMLERGRGAIVMIASATARIPTAQRAVYGATKAYMDFFAACLNREYQDQGITVQTLLPIFVANENAGKANLLVPTANNYAHQAIHTLGWVDRTNGSLTHTVQSWLAGFLPEFMAVWAARTMAKVFSKSKDSDEGKEQDIFMDTSRLLPHSLQNLIENLA